MRKGIGDYVLEYPDRSVLGQPQVIGVIGDHGGGADIIVLIAVFITVITIPTILLINNSRKNLDFTRKNHGEPFTAEMLCYAGKSSALMPFVEFTTESVGFEFEESEFAGGELAMTAGCVDVSD